MKTVGKTIIAVLCIGLVVGGFYLLSNKKASGEADNVSEVQKVILKDLTGDAYPATPREVLKLYNRIMCCYYNEEYTEEEFEKLADQARLLMDQELADNNPAEQYYMQVKAEVESYRSQKKTINNASVSDTNDVKFGTVDGAECAYLESSYFVRQKSGFSKSIQEYILRKDDEGKWKILAYNLKEGETAEDE